MILTVTFTKAKVCNRLHLTQITRASIDDACVRAAPFSIQHHFGSSGESTKLCPGDHPQPGVSGALRHTHRWWYKRKAVAAPHSDLNHLGCVKNTHKIDFVNRKRLCCTFTMWYQQLQAPIAIEVCGYSSCRSITVWSKEKLQETS